MLKFRGSSGHKKKIQKNTTPGYLWRILIILKTGKKNNKKKVGGGGESTFCLF